MQHQYWNFLKNSNHCEVCLVPWHISHWVIKIYEACASLRFWMMRCNLHFNNSDLWSRSFSVEQTKNIPEIEPPVWIWFSCWVGQSPTPARGSLSISTRLSRGMIRSRFDQNPMPKSPWCSAATSRFPQKRSHTDKLYCIRKASNTSFDFTAEVHWGKRISVIIEIKVSKFTVRNGLKAQAS